jgi:hypothetical protein
MKNKHIGTSLDSLLEEEGALAVTNAEAVARVCAWDSFFLAEEKVSDDFMQERASQEQPDREPY